MAEDILKINCLGQKCPLPVFRLERAFRGGHKHIEIKSDDPVSVIDIPHALTKWQAKLISQSHHQGVYKFEITRDIA